MFFTSESYPSKNILIVHQLYKIYICELSFSILLSKENNEVVSIQFLNINNTIFTYPDKDIYPLNMNFINIITKFLVTQHKNLDLLDIRKTEINYVVNYINECIVPVQ